MNNTDCHQVNKKKKGNHNLKWSFPFDCQPKSCASVTCSPHTKQQYHSSITNISHPISQKHSFLENQHAQGQTYIPIIGFPDPNYGIKIVNQIIKSLHLLISLCHLFFALLRGLSSSHSLVQTQCYIHN